VEAFFLELPYEHFSDFSQIEFSVTYEGEVPITETITTIIYPP